jgi:uncharacterized membrane-anchored protein
MKKYRWIIIILNLVLVILYFAFAVASKEKLLSNGKLVLLELAPKDPRSLMQGDYMRLTYAIGQGLKYDSVPTRGYCVVTLQPNGVAQRVRLQKNRLPLNPDETLIKYTLGKWTINIGAESYFFQEGRSNTINEAKYGGVKVDDRGNSILIGLYDSSRNKIE